MDDVIVLAAGAPRRAELEAQGWTVAARSFGAELDAEHVDRERLSRLATRVDDIAAVRELDAADVDAVLALDAATAGDYPGDVATQHEALDRCGATPSATRRAFGAFDPTTGELVAMTFVDADVDGTKAETDFTVVHGAWRGRGLGVAVKAASVLALLTEGISRMRTGGSADNTAILAADHALGYVRDEEWVTLRRTGAVGPSRRRTPSR